MLNHILNALGAVGNVLDLPGSSIRDTLALLNPFDQYLTPMSADNRTSGRDLLRHYGLAGQHDTWGNFAGGLAAETLLDPTNLLGAKSLINVMRARHAATEANAATRALHASHAATVEAALANNTRSAAMRAAGHMTAEEAARTATAFPGMHYISAPDHDTLGGALQHLASEPWIALNRDTHIDRRAIGFSSTPQAENAIPVRIAANNPFHATHEWTPTNLHRIAQESADLRQSLPDDLHLAGAAPREIAMATKRRTLKGTLERMRPPEHAGGLPTGKEVYSALDMHSAQPNEALHRAGYDSVVEHYLDKEWPSVMNAKSIRPWELAPAPRDIPPAAGLPTYRGLPPVRPKLGGLLGYNTLARSRSQQ